MELIGLKIIKIFLGEREYDTKFVSYKYHMNDFSASLGLENLKIMRKTINYHNKIEIYIPDI